MTTSASPREMPGVTLHPAAIHAPSNGSISRPIVYRLKRYLYVNKTGSNECCSIMPFSYSLKAIISQTTTGCTRTIEVVNKQPPKCDQLMTAFVAVTSGQSCYMNVKHGLSRIQIDTVKQITLFLFSCDNLGKCTNLTIFNYYNKRCTKHYKIIILL